MSFLTDFKTRTFAYLKESMP